MTLSFCRKPILVRNELPTETRTARYTGRRPCLIEWIISFASQPVRHGQTGIRLRII
jgi:hypothetical protein